MSKFKIGDKVIVVGTVDRMVRTITDINTEQAAPYKLDDDRIWWRASELQLVEPAEPVHKVNCNITENFMDEWKRMCKAVGPCTECPLHNSNNSEGQTCSRFVKYYSAEAIAIVQKWSNENPKKPPKTIKDDFLEKYPNAPLQSNKVPKSCPYHLGYEERCKYTNCEICWNRPLEEVQK